MTERVASPRPRSPASITAVLLVVVVAAGIIVDRVSPAATHARGVTTKATAGGVWACPVVSFGSRGGLVSVANASVEPSTVHIQILRPPQKPLASSFTLGPGHARSIVAPGVASGAVVQWAGGDVVASRSASLVTPGKRIVTAGGACSRTGDTTLVVPALSTLARDSHVILLNPSSADAIVGVSFLVDGDEQTPETLTGRSIPARGRLDVAVADYVFDKPSLAAVVRVSTGSVVADGVVIASQGAALVPAMAPRRDGVATAISGAGASVSVVSIGDDPATMTSTVMSPAGQETASRFPGTLDPLTTTSVAFPRPGPLGVGLSVRAGSPVAGVLEWSVFPRGAGDFAAAPFVTPATRWVAVTQGPVAGWSAQMVLSNPGATPVHLRARLLTSSGQVASGDLASITLLPGRVFTYPFETSGSVIGVEALSLDGPVGFSLVVHGGQRGAATLFAVAGVSPQRRSAFVETDPGTGIPAELR